MSGTGLTVDYNQHDPPGALSLRLSSARLLGNILAHPEEVLIARERRDAPC